MSIIIKDASLPKNCNECRLHDECGSCLASEVACDYKSSRRPADCPLVDADLISVEAVPLEKLETAKKMIKARFMDSGETVMQNETRRAVCREFIKILEEVCK